MLSEARLEAARPHAGLVRRESVTAPGWSRRKVRIPLSHESEVQPRRGVPVGPVTCWSMVVASCWIWVGRGT
jgi:hypothetical protein